MAEDKPNKAVSFTIFLVAYGLIMAGVLYGMSVVGLGTTPILVVGLILAGIGLLGAWSRTLSSSDAASS